jgi:ribosome maturation factor RimP
MDDIEEVLLKELKKVSEPLDIKIVELVVKKGKGGLNIKAIIYKDEGVTIGDCERISNLFNSRLSLLPNIEEENYNLQVSSPGLYRVFKDQKEYDIFKSRPVKIILKQPLDSGGKVTVLEGELLGIKDDIVAVEVEGKQLNIPLNRISKTKLNG